MSEMYEQMSLWGELFPYYKITNKLRVVELFGGVGSQIAACNILFNDNREKYEPYKLVEWTYQSYCAYNSIHIKDFKDYAEGKTKEEIIERIYGTSTDCETPLSLEQLNKKSMEWLKSAYNNCVATHNLVNIMNVSGKDLEINDTNKFTYLLTYSFPCQDISLCGLQKSFVKGSGTRSALLWEVERILDELKELTIKEKCNHLPQILIMENVDALISKTHIKQFQIWQHKLSELGYISYCDVLNGVNYGIPQTRKRVFLVSILGQYAYDFPKKVRPRYILKDFLENEVDEKYYLTKEHLDRIANWKAQQKPLDGISKHIETCPTITARGAGEEHSGMILIDENLINKEDVVLKTKVDYVKVLGNYSLSGFNSTKFTDPRLAIPTIMRNHCSVYAIPIKNNNSKGFILAEDGDGVDISGRMEYHRGTVQKGKSQTLTTKGGENVGVVVNEKESLFTESELALITPDLNIRRYIESEIIDKFLDGQIATTTFPNGYGHGPRTHDNCITLNTVDRPIVKQNLRIRKLTPCECWKLMGFTKSNFQDLSRNKFGDTELYRMAGDSIIVCCLIALISPFIYDRDAHTKIINDYVDIIVKGN